MSSDTLIDAFVRNINRAPRRRIREEDLPHPLREGGAEFGLYYEWTIQRFDHINWIAPIEATLHRALPPSYRSLVTRYIFPAFEVDSLTLLANTGRTLYNEMSMAMLHDKALSYTLIQNGYAQFARPGTGDSDPVCFDFTRSAASGECPIVRVNHHDLVATSTITVMQEIAPSFARFIDKFLDQTPQTVPVR